MGTRLFSLNGDNRGSLNIPWFRRSLSLVFWGLAVFVFFGFWNSLLKFKQAEEKVEEKRRYIEELKKEKEDLENKLKEINSEAYIEKRLRDDLSMAKEGEIVVVLPEEEIVRSLFIKRDFMSEEEVSLPNWRKWLVFFGF